jgi:hypothetical protein
MLPARIGGTNALIARNCRPPFSNEAPHRVQLPVISPHQSKIAASFSGVQESKFA